MVPLKYFDLVIDVESSIFYPDKDAFLREVARVLKDDGLFLFGFTNLRHKVYQIESLIAQYFEIVKEEDITSNVCRSLDLDAVRIRMFTEDNFPISKQHNNMNKPSTYSHQEHRAGTVGHSRDLIPQAFRE